MREIVLDTETTGFDPLTGDRLVEIGCIELVNHIPTGKNFHRYLNPERDMPEAAFRVHGLSVEFLSDKPKFAEVAEDFLVFIDEAQLLTGSPASPAEIGYACGFADQAHFTREFKRRTALTPALYRAEFSQPPGKARRTLSAR